MFELLLFAQLSQPLHTAQAAGEHGGVAAAVALSLLRKLAY